MIRSRVLCGLAILCYMGGDVGHVVYMCEAGVYVSMRWVDGIDREQDLLCFIPQL